MYPRLKITLSAISLGIATLVSSQNSAVALPRENGICQGKKNQAIVKQEQTSQKFYLNHSNGIYVVSDRQESFTASFKRRRIMAGKVISEYLPETFAAAAVAQSQCFVSYPSYNDDGSGKVTTYGLSFDLAPISPEIIHFWRNRPQSKKGWTTILLETDPQDSRLYHFVGWAEDQQFSFFSGELKGDSLNRRSLWYQGKS